MKITKKKLQEIIKEELEACLSEDFATIKFGLQRKSDLTREEDKIAFEQSLERLTKEKLKTRVMDAQLRVSKDKNDSISQGFLDKVKIAFPLRLKDGIVNSLEDLMKPTAAGYTDPSGMTGVVSGT